MIDNVIDSIKTFFRDTEATKAYLFGSYSRGEATENSDIDILVYFPDNINLLKIAKYKRHFENIIKHKVDLLTPGSISDRIYPFIEKDLKLIYELKR